MIPHQWARSRAAGEASEKISNKVNISQINLKVKSLMLALKKDSSPVGTVRLARHQEKQAISKYFTNKINIKFLMFTLKKDHSPVGAVTRGWRGISKNKLKIRIHIIKSRKI